MKKKFAVATFIALNIAFLNAQQWVLKKGTIMDSLPINDAGTEKFSLYLPTNFETTGNWPILFVFDMQGNGKTALRIFQEAAETQGYIIAASNSLNDSLSVSENILIANRLFNSVYNMLPIRKGRTYAGGVNGGGRFAALVPLFIKGVAGIVSIGGTIGNSELLSNKNPFYFIGIVHQENFLYPEMLVTETVLNGLKFPNTLMVAEDEVAIVEQGYIEKAMLFFTLSAMGKGSIEKDGDFIDQTYHKQLNEINLAKGKLKLIEANDMLEETMAIYRPLKDVDSLKRLQNALKKEKLFKTQKRNQTNVFFKEQLIKDDYAFALEEDIITYNYNNLGWWKYQMDELETKYGKSGNLLEQKMGKRLGGFINALVEDNIDRLMMEKPLDEQGLEFLWMLKTMIAPKEFGYYTKIISSSAKHGDFGTALLYVEELLKMGYKNKKELYELENTALLRITPEFNELVAKYLKEARYEIIDK